MHGVQGLNDAHALLCTHTKCKSVLILNDARALLYTHTKCKSLLILNDARALRSTLHTHTHEVQGCSDIEQCPCSDLTHARNARGPGLSFAGSFAAVDVVVVCCLFPVLRLKIVEVLDQKVRL